MPKSVSQNFLLLSKNGCMILKSIYFLSIYYMQHCEYNEFEVTKNIIHRINIGFMGFIYNIGLKCMRF